MGKKTAAMLLAASLTLSACGSAGTSEISGDSAASPDSSTSSSSNSVSPGNSTAGQPANDSGSKDQDQASSKGSANQTTSGSNPDSPAASSDVSQNQETTASTPAQTEIKYHMNKVYNIVPNEEGTEKKVVLLTFDDGPKEAEMINQIIDTLDKHKAKAIFFVNGYRVKSHPELLKLIQKRGQVIGNHSWDHIVLKDQSEAEVRHQIEDVQKIIKEVTGKTPVFFRPPHGAGGDIGRKVAKENGLLYMTWSNGSLDWEMKAKDPNKSEAIIKNVMDQLHPGSNILMHELPWTAETLDQLLTKLEQKGYSFVDPNSIDASKQP
ncbi:polysaccharide deacetylase family protein [Paenibacillus sp. JX-17]|uniref:Polysaccharide deacetylase family protein n=1 Tax=Paenibacillus lacisoli TaxID=3064525 RepID=A0ABT9C782_9BACL|nr:polysaccharide deacetylase family protein [Paenibacillus sp. JX-17]MDO7905100.1 polysaccharide deacetylase family protein [Paenibacillus sp. JX-17]